MHTLLLHYVLQELRKLQEVSSSSSETGSQSNQSSKKPSSKKSKPATPPVTPPTAKQPAGKSKRKKVTIDEVVESDVTEDTIGEGADSAEKEEGEIREKLSDIKQVKVR